jgi:hypothetical protein
MSRKTWSYVIVSVALAGTLQACGGGGGTVGATGTTPPTVGAPDTSPPTITAFTLPATAASLTVSVNSFTATDDKGVTGFMVTQSATPPAATAAGWTATAPATVTAAGTGSQTFFPWAKDAAGNVSAVGTSATVNIDATAPVVPADTTAPAVTAFTMPASAASLIVSVSTFTATDNVAVTGYMVTQSATPPGAGAAGWTATATATVTAAAAGSQNFFPWAKDAAGNVSAVGTPATVTITLPPASVAVSASGTDTTSAVGADATFTFAAVANIPIQYNISGFGPGDKLVFPVFGGAPNLIDIINLIPTDGIVTVHLRRGVGGDQFEITVVLDGLTAAQDGQIVDGERDPFASFNAVFGANSIQQL